MKLVALSAALLLVSGASASLHQAAEHHRGFVRRAGPRDAAAMAKITDPNQACKDYSVPEIDQMRKNNRFPKPNHIATIADGDDEAKQVWKEIQDMGIIPKHIKPKPPTDKEHSQVKVKGSGYDENKDPDCWWSATMCRKPKAKGVPHDIDECNEPKTYGLTFDDGPNCTHNVLYDFLKEKELKATLFYIGSYVFNLPYQAQRGLADGHDICGHTWSHRAMSTLSDEQVFAELFYTTRVLKAVLGVTVTCWRPPFGDVDDRVRAIAAGLGLRTITWKSDTDDWSMEEPGHKQQVSKNYDKIISRADKESPIVLAHELYNSTMSMFINKYPAISQAFDHIAPVSACANITSPYLEEDYTYPDFNEFVSGNAKYQGLPKIEDMKINPDVKISPVRLDKLDHGFVPGGDKKKKSSSNGSNGGDNGNGSSGDNSGGDDKNASPSNDEKQGKDAALTTYAASFPVLYVATFFTLFTLTLQNVL